MTVIKPGDTFELHIVKGPMMPKPGNYSGLLRDTGMNIYPCQVVVSAIPNSENLSLSIATPANLPSGQYSLPSFDPFSSAYRYPKTVLFAIQ